MKKRMVAICLTVFLAFPQTATPIWAEATEFAEEGALLEDATRDSVTSELEENQVDSGENADSQETRETGETDSEDSENTESLDEKNEEDTENLEEIGESSQESQDDSQDEDSIENSQEDLLSEEDGTILSEGVAVLKANAQGWIKKDGKYYYYTKSSNKVTGLKKIGKYYYYFDNEGVLQTGWRRLGNYDYYFKKGGKAGVIGRASTGFKTLGGSYYNFSPTGKLRTGLRRIKGNYYYFRESGSLSVKGKMKTGFVKIGNASYYFSKSGSKYELGKQNRSGFTKINGKTYYFTKANGKMKTGLSTIGRKTYFFDGKGVLWGNMSLYSDYEMKLLKDALNSWNGKLSWKRKHIINRALTLVGSVTYSQKMRNQPNTLTPSYLDCSAYVANCYMYGIGATDITQYFSTDNFLYGKQFKNIKKADLQPGDIFLTFKNGHASTGNHVGIYLGKSDGQDVYIHCSGDVNESSGNNLTNRAIVVSVRNEDQRFRTYRKLNS